MPRARELSVSPGVASKGARGMLKERTIIGVLGLALAGCQTVAESQTQGTREDFGACKNLSFETPDGMLLKRRLWVGDGTDSASKLTDPLPLTQAERDALARYTASVLPCRQTVAEHDGTDAVGAMPASQTFWARTDEIRTKLRGGRDRSWCCESSSDAGVGGLQDRAGSSQVHGGSRVRRGPAGCRAAHQLRDGQRPG